MKRLLLSSIVALGVISIPLTTIAHDEKGADKKAEKQAPAPKPQSFVTQHKGTFGGVKVSYELRAEDTVIKDKKGNPSALMFTMSYVKTGKNIDPNRPISFVFNGGPGSPSMWLHMGLLGPKRVPVASDADSDDGAAPYAIVDNNETILDLTDLVFVDPIGTGFSRLLPDGDPKQFYGVGEDAKYLSDFVEKWITKNKRWNSPKYIIGESYGTMRAAAMANELEVKKSLSLNGIIMISNFMEMKGQTFEVGNEIGFYTLIPTQAALNWYHSDRRKNGTADLEAFIEESRQFALGDYAHALILGNRISPEMRAATIKKLSYFIGLSEDFLDQANMRVNHRQFQKELLRDQGVTIGRLDGRYFGPERELLGDHAKVDPFNYQMGSAYTAGFQTYAANDMGIAFEDRDYHGGGGPKNWNWETKDTKYFGDVIPVNTAPYLGEAQRRNTSLKIMMASGYYDLVTPFFDAENNFSRNGIDGSRIDWYYYPTGHMMYVHEPSRIQLLKDIREFYAK